MIADRLVNAQRYTGLGPRVARALEFLEHTDLDAIADGRHEVDGANVFALVQRYTSKLEAEGFWEAHRRYADLQFVVAGEERIGYGPRERFTGTGYDAEKDFEILTGSGDFLALEAGGFVLLWPGEVHMPQVAVAAPAPVTKVVVKIRMD
jgi:YhcH/YjgK/YiaL family protein